MIFSTTPNENGEESEYNIDKDIYSSHAYSIIDYNPKTDIVTYINPWNSTLTHDMELKGLAKYIERISSMCR